VGVEKVFRKKHLFGCERALPSFSFPTPL